MSEKTQAQAALARKITIATITGGPTKWFEDLINAPDKMLKLCAMYGYATGFKAGATDFGEYIKFNGSFEGVNMVTGEIQRAGQIILPTFLAGPLQSALAQADAKTVQFAFEIHATFDPSAAQKFVYTVYDRMPPAQNDPLDALRANVQKALAAPSNVEKLEDHTTKAAAASGRRK